MCWKTSRTVLYGLQPLGVPVLLYPTARCVMMDVDIWRCVFVAPFRCMYVCMYYAAMLGGGALKPHPLRKVLRTKSPSCFSSMPSPQALVCKAQRVDTCGVGGGNLRKYYERYSTQADWLRFFCFFSRSGVAQSPPPCVRGRSFFSKYVCLSSDILYCVLIYALSCIFRTSEL